MIRAFLAIELPPDLRAALATDSTGPETTLERTVDPGEGQLGSTGLDAPHAQVPRRHA